MPTHGAKHFLDPGQGWFSYLRYWRWRIKWLDDYIWTPWKHFHNTLRTWSFWLIHCDSNSAQGSGERQELSTFSGGTIYFQEVLAPTAGREKRNFLYFRLLIVRHSSLFRRDLFLSLPTKFPVCRMTRPCSLSGRWGQPSWEFCITAGRYVTLDLTKHYISSTHYCSNEKLHKIIENHFFSFTVMVHYLLKWTLQ